MFYILFENKTQPVMVLRHILYTLVPKIRVSNPNRDDPPYPPYEGGIAFYEQIAPRIVEAEFTTKQAWERAQK